MTLREILNEQDDNTGKTGFFAADVSTPNQAISPVFATYYDFFTRWKSPMGYRTSGADPYTLVKVT